MRLWILSDWHLNRRRGDFNPPRPAFDVLVVAGDVSDTMKAALEAVSALAAGKPAVFVPGPLEYFLPGPEEAKVEGALAYAKTLGVTLLKRSAAEVEGIRFAGATLWTSGDSRFFSCMRSLQAADADVVVTHFEPGPMTIQLGLRRGGLWVCGQRHGRDDSMIANRRLVRNAVGFGEGERLRDSKPARLDFTVEV